MDSRHGGSPQAAADHLMTLMAQSAQAPVAMVHLLDGEQLRLVGAYGLPPQWASALSVPVSSALAGLVIAQGRPMVIGDITADARVPTEASARAMGERAYLGYPVRDVDGAVAGVCAVLDYRPRLWRPDHLTAVDQGAQACTAFVAGPCSAARTDEAQRLLAALLHSLQIGVAACDAAGRLVFSNQANQNLNGELPEGIDLRAWARQKLVQPPAGMLPPAVGPLMRALAGERLHGTEIMVERPQQRPSMLLADAEPVTDADGGSLGAVVTFQDVTHRHSAAVLKDCELTIRRLLSDSEIRPADELLQETIGTIGRMLDWAATEFWTIDEVGTVLLRRFQWTDERKLLPPGLPERLGHGQGMPGRAWQTSETVWATDLSTDTAARVQAVGWGPLRSAVAVPVPIGSVTRGVLACYSTYTEHPDDVRTAVMAGIAAHIGQFLERRRGSALSDELEHSRDEYIALVGHEIRTPLTSILSYAAMMVDDPDLPTGDRVEMLQVVRRNTGRLQVIIDKLLDIAGMQSGDIAIDSQRMDLSATVRAAAAAFRTRFTGKDVTFDIDGPDEAILWGDPRRLTQVVDELLTNAVDWADDGSRIIATVTTDGPATQLTVSNTGQVIPAAEREQLFQRFFRTQGALTNAVPGTGLGLSLARTIIEQHGGTITATSDDDPPGTTITVRLPTDRPAPPPDGIRATTADAAPGAAG
ncbi:GAF domain-containing protein [Actinoplanes sp. NEAU-A12]|uniref:histidine kinase n=1 Tax=Actinoplanes sandaracinus TaxID=3045177 RepID=A0ABT6WWZ5_9ACTN|nr:ATP-binding protein [Actinoplanes sandaracinus]MDI6104136.1 GAF domain-containing protein [Actinoplanes sandaracinus]